MAMYQYTVRAFEGSEAFSGTCYADNEGVVRSDLKRMGYRIKSLTQRKSSDIFGKRKRIKLQDLVSMCRRFSVMYGAGMSLLECLSVLAQDNESKKLSEVLQDIHDRITQGSNVADAFSRHQDVFSPLFVNLLRAGEKAGKFDYVLCQLAEYLEQEYDMRRKIRQALAYPIAVIIMIFVVVTVIVIFVMPAFSDVYSKLGITLPGPTIALIFLSNNAVYVFPATIMSAVGLWISYKKLRVVPSVKARLDKMKLSMAMIGPVYHKMVILKFVHTLSIMVSAGIQLLDTIAVAADVANNAVVTEAANMILRNIKRGGTITEAIKLHAIFPRAVVHAFATGEESGRLEQMLGNVVNEIKQDVDDAMKKLLTKIEPVLMMFMSVVIGFILMAIYLPVFDLVKVLGEGE